MIGKLESGSQWSGMQFRVLAEFLVLAMCVEQTTMVAGAQGGPPVQMAGQTITVVAGTQVPLTLVSPIKSKSTKVGDTVRAVVAFPITVDVQVAIPAGTYVEGLITSLTAQAKGTHQPDVQIHFTRLLYANGYTVTLDAANIQAKVELPNASAEEVMSGLSYPASYGVGRTKIAFYGGEGFAYLAQTSQEPTVPTLPQVGPTIAKTIGITFGAIAALIVTGIIFGRHHQSNADYVLFDAGWQFQMTLASPLTVDAGQVAAAAATPTH